MTDAWEGELTPQEKARIDAAWEKHKAAVPICGIPPKGWQCSRAAGHDGPCAARPSTAELQNVAQRMADILKIPFLAALACMDRGAEIERERKDG